MVTNQLENKRRSGAVPSTLAETSRLDNAAAVHRSRRLSASRKPKAEVKAGYIIWTSSLRAFLAFCFQRQTSTQRKSRSASRTSNSLLVEYTKMEQRRSRPRPSIFRRPTHLYKPARPWACRVCGYIFGTFHLAFGVGLLILDLATNWITETVFAITAGICFVVTGIASLIATKRLDKGTITILLLFSIVSLILSLIIAIESSTSINYLCHKGDCAEHEATVRACLLILCLMEMVNAVLSCFISVRSLLDCADADLIKPISPVRVFLIGQKKPSLKNIISSEQAHALITASHK
ncbi:hypothetical protein T07_1786 [Trichinella nelsoni]|uniref:Uncharacterized protein n=1 Tax=Trichinella nelsoni TaxID=6336 RepID=A0A0V0RVT6_9BILA|nr:hypothetical protein T07_1786 [Trichinella nelsoni]